MKQTETVIAMPIGPNAEYANICDTIESIYHFITSSNVIILIDDSWKKTGLCVKERFPDIIILPTPWNYGPDAGLYLTLSIGYTFALENYNFDALLKIDDDTLIIGHNPEIDAIEYFKEHPDCEIIGSFRTDCNGDPRDFSCPSNQIAKEMGFRSLLKSPLKRLKGWFFLRKIYDQSIHNGYEAGEHCLGGAYFISRSCIERLYENNLLSHQEISWSRLQEDHIFSLLAHSVGFKNGDFATNSLPIGIRWRGLPCSPEELVRRKKKITHSTRFFSNMSEQEIRQYFKEQREKDKALL